MFLLLPYRHIVEWLFDEACGDDEGLSICALTGASAGGHVSLLRRLQTTIRKSKFVYAGLYS